MVTASVTSKNQITLSEKAFGKIRKGQKFLIQKKGDSFVLTPAELLVKKLSGRIQPSQKIPDMNVIIQESISKEFSQKT